MSPGALAEASANQSRAGRELEAALRGDASHAYLFRGPAGSGKRALARAFAAELIAAAAQDPEDARRRALLDPSPHPDLTWLSPKGLTYAVEDIRERVIATAVRRPFEGGRRVFVIESAEALREESQNAMLKTLEEPPPFAHLILLTSEPEALLPTVASRCQTIEFAALPREVVVAELAGSAPEERVEAASRLSRGDLDRARFLASEPGEGLRAAVEALMGAARAGELGGFPWSEAIQQAEGAGDRAAAEAERLLESDAEVGIKHSRGEAEDAVKRARRRARTEVLDLYLALCGQWCRDWIAVASGGEELVANVDRMAALREQAAELDVRAAADAAEIVADTRRRLELNASEELALEAMTFRLERLLAPA